MTTRRLGSSSVLLGFAYLLFSCWKSINSLFFNPSESWLNLSGSDLCGEVSTLGSMGLKKCMEGGMLGIKRMLEKSGIVRWGMGRAKEKWCLGEGALSDLGWQKRAKAKCHVQICTRQNKSKVQMQVAIYFVHKLYRRRVLTRSTSTCRTIMVID